MRFESDGDRARQRAAANKLQAVWDCAIVDQPEFRKVDWHCWRGFRVVAIAEYKNRTTSHDAYPTAFLSKLKYDALVEEGQLMRVPSFFVWEFTDGLYWVDIATVDASNAVIQGRPPRAGSSNDQQLIIDVPISQLKAVP